MLGKLMGLAGVGTTWANITLLNRFLSNVTTVVLLTMISAVLCCFLLLGGFFAIYLVLVHNGLDPYVAAITVSCVIGILTIVAVGMTVMKIRQLSDLSRQGPRQIPGIHQAGSIAVAFMEGLGRRPTRT